MKLICMKLLGMKLIHTPAFFAILVVLLAACSAVPVQLDGGNRAPVAPAVDSALPHAKSVLLRRCTDQGCALHLIDPASGQSLPAYPPVALGNSSAVKRSPDLRALAVIDYRNNQNSQNGLLKLIDLSTWQTLTTTLTFDKVYDSFFFSPDSKRLVVNSPTATWPPKGQLELLDLVQQQRTAQQMLDFNVRQLHFSMDGQWLMLYGMDGSPDYMVNPHSHVALLRAADLQIVWQQTLPAVRDGFFNVNPDATPHEDPEKTTLWEPALVFAPDGRYLYIVHADENQLTTVDFSARTAHTVAITPVASWLERLLALTARSAKAKAFNGVRKQAVIAPTGKRLYVTTVEHIFKANIYTETAQNVQVIDLTSGVEIAQLDSQAHTVGISADGTQLYLQGWENGPRQSDPAEWTEIVDTANLQQMAKLPDRAIALGQRLDGTPILLSSITRQDGRWEAAALDPATFQLLHAWTSQQTGGWGGFITQ